MSAEKIFCDLIFAAPLLRQTILAYATGWVSSPQNTPSALIFRAFPDLAAARLAWPEQPPDLLLVENAADILVLAKDFPAARPQFFLWGQPTPATQTDIQSQNIEIQDIFEKPIALATMMARLTACARRFPRAETALIPLGPWLFNPNQRNLKDPRTETFQKLTEKESALLETFLGTTTPLSRAQILATLWDYAETADTHTLETHIYNLRQKLTLLPFSPQDPFQNLEGGYLLHPAWRASP